jgi:hypothetical protein
MKTEPPQRRRPKRVVPEKNKPVEQHVVYLRRKCKECGRNQFRITYSMGKWRYKIVAHCTACNRGVVIALDELHRAAVGKRKGADPQANLPEKGE